MECDILEKIARFKLKKDVDLNGVNTSPYAKYINDGAIKGTYYSLCHEITVNIGFPEDLSKWNDFDYILVLDEDFGQPYIPFYKYLYDDSEKSNWPTALEEIVKKYNETLRGLPYLEEIK